MSWDLSNTFNQTHSQQDFKHEKLEKNNDKLDTIREVIREESGQKLQQKPKTHLIDD